MTVEYVLLLVCTVMIAMKFFASAPGEAFKNSGPRLGTRIERQLQTGGEFKTTGGKAPRWVGKTQ